MATAFLTGGIFYFRRWAREYAVTLFRSGMTFQRMPLVSNAVSPLTWKRRADIWRRGVIDAESLLRAIFDFPAWSISGILYGLIIGVAPVVLGIHEREGRLQLLLTAFLFGANVVAGAALYATMVVLWQSWHLAKRIEISFFVRNTPTVSAYANMLTTNALIGAAYISLCQLSIVFSRFAGVWVIGYAIVALFLYFMMYYVPQEPIRHRLLLERDSILLRISSAKSRILEGEIDVAAIDALSKIQATEDRVLKMGLGLPRWNTSLVRTVAIVAGTSPIVAIFIKELAALLFG